MTPVQAARAYMASTSTDHTEACAHIDALLGEVERYEDDLRDHFAGLAMQGFTADPVLLGALGRGSVKTENCYSPTPARRES